MSESFILNRKQMNKLVEIANHFKEVKHFKISVDNSSGIGVGVVVSFDLFEDSDSNIFGLGGDTKIDITDVSEW